MTIFRTLIISLIIISAFSCKHKQKNDFEIKNGTKLIVLTTENWETKEAKITLSLKKNNKWEAYAEFDAIIGRKGLGMGTGLHNSINEVDFSEFPQKKEGDGKSPAGIFSISEIYGYSPTLFCESNLNYTQIKAGLHAVDDVNSRFYNQIIDSTKVEPDYNSFENLINMSYYYEWFFRIDHNPENVKGKGSLIFFHIKDKRNAGSAGCTTVSRENMIKTLKWIDKETLIIQMPIDLYKKVSKVIDLY